MLGAENRKERLQRGPGDETRGGRRGSGGGEVGTERAEGLRVQTEGGRGGKAEDGETEKLKKKL